MPHVTDTLCHLKWDWDTSGTFYSYESISTLSEGNKEQTILLDYFLLLSYWTLPGQAMSHTYSEVAIASPSPAQP